jgi:hypothetical protein
MELAVFPKAGVFVLRLQFILDYFGGQLIGAHVGLYRAVFGTHESGRCREEKKNWNYEQEGDNVRPWNACLVSCWEGKVAVLNARISHLIHFASPADAHAEPLTKAYSTRVMAAIQSWQ